MMKTEINDELLDKVTGGGVDVRQNSECTVFPNHYVCAPGCVKDGTCGTCIHNSNRGSEIGSCDTSKSFE